MHRAVIIGGGISGLSAAYYLNKAGVPAVLIERAPRLGGVIQTETVNGCVLEEGPDSFLSAKPAALELIREVGLASDVIGSNDHLRVTYIWKGGRLIPLPDGMMMMVPTKFTPILMSPLLSWATKIRMGLEIFRQPGNGSGRDRTVSEFIEDHYGRESVDYLAEPLLSGVYGGSPDRLSVASVLTRFVELEGKYGSLTRGVLASRRAAGPKAQGAPLFRTLKGGLAQLTRTLEEKIRPNTVVIQAEADALERTDSGFRVRAGAEWIEAANVVVATPAWQAGGLLGAVDPVLAELLRGVQYSSSMTLALGYEKATLGHSLKGFGFLVPAKERGRLVACTWVGTKFSHRVPEGQAVLRCFLGGAADEGILDESDEAVVAIVLEELHKIMGITAKPSFYRIARWKKSMAQYTVGHQARVISIEERLAAQPNLYLAGNAYYGIGIPDCIKMGRQAADRIAAS
ncbi:MAG: protoporphyrinogen oxidase [Bryobacteraceae bacterium]